MRKMKRGIRCLAALLLACALVVSQAGAEILYGPEPAEIETVDAKAALLVDVDTGDTLYALNAEDRNYPASCTKIMTCLLTIEAIEAGELSLDQIITVEDSYAEGLTPDSSTANLTAGEEISLENVLYCLMLASANEAGNILAVTVSGSISAFADRMNERAAELGCTGTHFCNPHGLHDENHYTTARDLSVITMEAWKHDLFRTLVGTTYYTVPATNKSEERNLVNSNMLLPQRGSVYSYEYATGVKTGTTNAAGYCLVSTAETEGRTVLAVVLGAKMIKHEDNTTTRMVYVESQRLLDYGLTGFQNLVLASGEETVAQLPVTGGEEGASVNVIPAEEVTYGLVNGLTADSFQREVSLPDSLEAPVEQGDVVGTMTFCYEGQAYAQVELVAGNSAALPVVEPPAEETAEPLTPMPAEKTSTSVILIGAAVLAVILIIIVVCWIVHSRRRYRGRRVRK